MILYDSVGPNPRVVRMFMAEKGLAMDTVMIDIMRGENREQGYLSINPGGTTPALVLDDGRTLTEITAICEYLEELRPEPALIGTTPEERAFTRMWVRRIDLSVALPMTLAFRAAEGRPMFESRTRVVRDDAAGDLKLIAHDGLQAIEAQLSDAAWIAGDRFTLADILLFAFVEFGRLVGQPLAPTMYRLSAWHERLAARSSAKA